MKHEEIKAVNMVENEKCDGECAAVGFIFNKREMEMPARVRTRALSGCIIINGDRCIFHAAPRELLHCAANGMNGRILHGQ